MSDDPTPAVLSFLADRLRQDPHGNPYFLADDDSVILDTSAPGCPPADARAVAAWTRSHRPELWGQPTTKAAAPTSTTAAAIMDRVRAGDLSAAEATARILAIGATATTSAPSRAVTGADTRAPAPTISDLMIAVRRGVPGAQGRLETAMKGAF